MQIRRFGDWALSPFSGKMPTHLGALDRASTYLRAAEPTQGNILYSVGGYLISSDHKLYRVTSLKTPFGLVIPLFQSQSHVTTITHNYFLRCYAFTQL
jgi:hypothetical protein